MIWKGVATHPPPENTGVIRVLPHWTKVEYPKVVAVPGGKKTLSIFASISVKAFKANRWIAHNDDLISHICKVYVRTWREH